MNFNFTTRTPVTTVVIIFSILVSLVSQFGANPSMVHYLYFSEYLPMARNIDIFNNAQIFMPEIMHGQIWRIFTPMFLHFGAMHIIFNVLWLKDLGGMIEEHLSSAYLINLILVIAGLSNTAQYLWSGPLFGGLSGVVYGLLGFLWIRGKLDPWFELQISQQTVIMMIIWFFVCLFGIVGNVANMAHGVGLATGMIWGFIAAMINKSINHRRLN